MQTLTVVAIKNGERVVVHDTKTKAMIFILANKKNFKYLIEDVNIPCNLTTNQLMEYARNTHVNDTRLILRSDIIGLLS
jgi:hypothetical protein